MNFRLPSHVAAPAPRLSDWRQPLAQELSHRTPRLVWASGEHLGQARLSLGSELMRCGIKEWGGVARLSAIDGVDGEGRLSAPALEAMQAALEPEYGMAELPIIVCRDPRVPGWVAERSAMEGSTVVGFVGHPFTARLAPAEASRFHWTPPVSMPPGFTVDDFVWLGAPDAACRRDPGIRPPPFVSSLRGLKADAAPMYLNALTAHLGRRQPLRLWMVVFLDRLRLGRPGHDFLDDEVLACLLNWMQCQLPDPGLILLSEAPMPAALRERVGVTARQLGVALFRHRQAQGLAGMRK